MIVVLYCRLAVFAANSALLEELAEPLDLGVKGIVVLEAVKEAAECTASGGVPKDNFCVVVAVGAVIFAG